MNKFYFLVILSGFISFSSCQKKKAEPQAVRVEVVCVTQQDVQTYIEAIGNVFEHSIVRIRPQVQGILIKAHQKQGSYVKEGDLLYEVDPRTYAAALAEARATLVKDKATLAFAENTVSRYTQVAAKDYLAPLTFDQYKTNVQTASAQVALDIAAEEIACINLDNCTISSPMNGKIGIYNIYPGNLVLANDPNAIVEIRQMAPIDIQFPISQRDFQEIQKFRSSAESMKFEVFLPYEKEKKCDGTLFFIDNHIDLLTGTILLKGSVDNEKEELWPGEFARVHLLTQLEKDALVIPASAVQWGQKGSYVYVVNEDMTVRFVQVIVGQKTGSDIVIKEGLSLNELVVTNGQLNLREGSKITISASRGL